MTIPQLYALYRAGHRAAWCATDGGVHRPFEVTVSGPGLGQLERLMLELALHDASNGTPMRSREAFERALAEGCDVLAPLGLTFGFGELAAAEARRKPWGPDGVA